MIWTEDARASAMAEAQSWRGTPWANRRATKGVGVDCLHFVLQVLKSADIIEAATVLPYYDMSLGLRSEKNVLAEALEKHLYVQEVKASGLTFGDLLVWRCGDTSNHLGIMLDKPWEVRRRSQVGPRDLALVIGDLQCGLRLTQRGLRCTLAGARYDGL